MRRLSRAAHRRMVECAEADYPEETCGFLFARAAGGDGTSSDGALAEGDLEVVPMENIQNRLHREDPSFHTRDAKTAYCFDPQEMQRVLRRYEEAGQPLCGIYHSHPDNDAYFSETDSAAAAPFGEPSYPGVVYYVYSVRSGRVAAMKAFDWSADAEAYVEIEVAVEPGS